MNVVFIQQSVFGGLGRVIEQLAVGLKKRGWGVRVLSYKIDESIEVRLRESGVRYERVDIQRVPTAWKAIRRVVSENDDSVLVSSGTLLNVFVLAASKLHGGKRPICVRDDVDVWASTEALGVWKRALIRGMVRMFYSSADLRVVVCNALKAGTAKMADIASEAVRVIPNPAWDPDFARLGNELVSHRWVGSGPLVVSTGRFVEQKDFLTLIRAMPSVHRETGARCIIVGDGPEKERLSRSIKDIKAMGFVELVGWDPNPFRWVKRANVYVLASNYEGFGLVIVEAMGLGVSVVSSDCKTGPREILQDGDYGHLVPVGNVPAMSKAIVHALNRPYGPELLKAEAEKYSIPRAVDEYERALKAIRLGR